MLRARAGYPDGFNPGACPRITEDQSRKHNRRGTTLISKAKRTRFDDQNDALQPAPGQARKQGRRTSVLQTNYNIWSHTLSSTEKGRQRPSKPAKSRQTRHEFWHGRRGCQHCHFHFTLLEQYDTPDRTKGGWFLCAEISSRFLTSSHQ